MSTPSDDEQTGPAERYAAFQREKAFPMLKDFAGLYGFELDDFQVRACQEIESGRGVLVAAPTGSGKTIVGEFAIHLARSVTVAAPGIVTYADGERFGPLPLTVECVPGALTVLA